MAGVILMLTALLVWMVDPYGALGHNSIGIYAESERQAKPAMLHASGSRTILIGSSKVSYIDPGVLGPTAFNAAFSAAMPEEIVNFLRHHVPRGSLVVIGLDSFMMNTHAYPLAPDTFAEVPSITDTLSYLFGLRPAWAAVTALTSHAIGTPPALLPHGQRNAIGQIERHNAMTGFDHAHWLNHVRTQYFSDFVYAPERATALHEMRQVAKERNLTLHVFINPLSEPVRTVIASLPAAEDVQRFRADVRQALPGAVDLSMDPDFADPALYFRFDPFHYLPATGADALRKVMAQPPVATTQEPPVAEAPLGVVRGDDYPAHVLGLTLNNADAVAETARPQDSKAEAVQ